MRRFSIVFILIPVLILLNACLYRNVKSPGPINYGANYQFTTEDFHILGTVEAEGVYTNILGSSLTGGNGYAVLMEKAKALGGDDIIRYTMEFEEFGILHFIYNRFTWRAWATVIKYKEKAKGPAASK